jgi:hypothetical protein
MNEGKLGHSVFGAAISWLLAAVAWTEAHMALVAGIAAAIASVYTIFAARATTALRRAQKRQVEIEIARREANGDYLQGRDNARIAGDE